MTTFDSLQVVGDGLILLMMVGISALMMRLVGRTLLGVGRGIAESREVTPRILSKQVIPGLVVPSAVFFGIPLLLREIVVVLGYEHLTYLPVVLTAVALALGFALIICDLTREYRGEIFDEHTSWNISAVRGWWRERKANRDSSEKEENLSVHTEPLNSAVNDESCAVRAEVPE